MLDFYGNTYVEGRRTRFTSVAEVAAYQSARNSAFLAWLDHVHSAIPDVEMNVTTLPNFASSTHYATFSAIGTSLDITLYHYDSLTRAGVDPAASIVAMLKWNAAHPE